MFSRVKITTFIAVLLCSIVSPCFGQADSYDDCDVLHSLYYEHYKQNNFSHALPFWQKLAQKCPTYGESMYVHGAKMYRDLVEKESDASHKDALIDSLLTIFDLRIEHYENDGFLRGRKGGLMMRYRPSDASAALLELQKAHAISGDSLEPGAVLAMFQAQFKLYKTRHAGKTELFGTAAKCFNVIDRYLAKTPSDRNETTAKTYLKAERIILKSLRASWDYDNLELIYQQRLRIRKDDSSIQNQIMEQFTASRCTSSDLFAQSVDYFIDSGKLSPGLCLTQGDMKFRKNDINGAVAIYQKGLETTTSPDSIYLFQIRLAQSNLMLKKYKKVHAHCKAALQANPNSGEAFLLLGDAYAASRNECVVGPCSTLAVYWIAVDMFKKSKAVDPSIAQKANKRIAAAESLYPTREDCFFEGLAEGQPYTIKCWINATTTVRVRK
jgi:tetratricopeptide (TPR) repeat protein